MMRCKRVWTKGKKKMRGSKSLALHSFLYSSIHKVVPWLGLPYPISTRSLFSYFSLSLISSSLTISLSHNPSHPLFNLSSFELSLLCSSTRKLSLLYYLLHQFNSFSFAPLSLSKSLPCEKKKSTFFRFPISTSHKIFFIFQKQFFFSNKKKKKISTILIFAI